MVGKLDSYRFARSALLAFDVGLGSSSFYYYDYSGCMMYRVNASEGGGASKTRSGDISSTFALLRTMKVLFSTNIIRHGP